MHASLPIVSMCPLPHSRVSSLYNPSLDASDWYNTTSGSPDINAYNFPFGFFHETMDGFTDGYALRVYLYLLRIRHLCIILFMYPVTGGSGLGSSRCQGPG